MLQDAKNAAKDQLRNHTHQEKAYTTWACAGAMNR